MKLTFLVIALAAVFQTSSGTLTAIEKQVAYFQTLQSAITNIIDTIETIAEDLVGTIVNVPRSSVKMYVYNQSSIDTAIATFTLADITPFYKVFNKSKECFYVVHGFINNYDSDVNTVTKQAVLARHDVTVVVVDWYSYTGYVYARDAVPYVGKYLGEFISNVSAKYNYTNDNVRMAGHSLGAHVCGIAGQVNNGTIKQIVGMDPAGPLYNLENDTSVRLSPDDAKDVQAIHTNSLLYGIKYACGHSDYWLNGGATQPSCNILEDFVACSHQLAFTYYAESVTSGGFDAIKCNSNSFTSNGTKNYCCNPFERVYMGQYSLDKRANGSYFLTTNDASPYAKGRKFNSNDTTWDQ